MNEPTLTDYYIMQLNADFLRANSKRSSTIKMQDLRIRFGSPPLRAQDTELAKAVWLSRMKRDKSGKLNVRTVTSRGGCNGRTE